MTGEWCSKTIMAKHTSTGILTDGAILSAVEKGDIEIDPFNPKHVNVTSYDLTLGNMVSVYRAWVVDPMEVATRSIEGQVPIIKDGSHLALRGGWRGEGDKEPGVLDAKEIPSTIDYEINPDKGWLLKPGIGYLMHTKERVRTMKYNPILDGKSSIGRLFIQVHATAGYGDPGFDGQYTLEVIVQHPVRVYPGMRICQIRFQTLFTDGPEEGPMRTYDAIGNYTAEKARGPVASQAYKQFR